MAVTRYLSRKSKQFRLVFDEYGVLDTVEQIFAKDAPKMLTSRNADVKHFVTHQDRIYVGMAPEGSKMLRQSDLFPQA
jgi:hypothetical protein